MRTLQCRPVGCRNTAGIVLNLGWYALCECILTDHSPNDALHRWCGLERKPKVPCISPPGGTRKYVMLDVEKLRVLKEKYYLSYNDLARLAGISYYPFFRALRYNRGRMWDIPLRRLEENLRLEKGCLELRKDNAGAC